MANRFWVGSGTNWNSTASWSTTSGGASGSAVPTASDDVIFDSHSGNATINVNSLCRSLDCTSGTGNYTGTITQSPSIALNIGTSTVNPSGVALKLVSGMAYSLGSNCLINFVSTSASQVSVTTGTIVIPNPNFNGTNGSWINNDGMTVSGTITMSSGTWNTNNQAISANAISFGATVVRTLTFGSSVFSLFASTGALTGNTGNLTITPNTATFVMSPSGSSGTPWNPSVSTDYKGASVVLNLPNASSYTITPGASKVANLIVTCGNSRSASVLLASTPTVLAGIAFQGFSATSRLMVISSVFGTQRTITNTGASVVNQITTGGTTYQTQYCDIQDIKFTDAADLSGNIQPGNTSPILSGDCQGNSGITFTIPQDQYCVMTGATNYASNTWFTTSGGSTPGRVPLPQDNVHINGNSGNFTLTMDMPRYGANIDFTGFGGTASFSSITGYPQSQAFGNWTFGSGMAVAGTATVSLQGRRAQTIQNNGIFWPSSCVPASATGSYTLLDALQAGSNGNSNCTTTSGSFNTGGFNVSCAQFFFNNSTGGGTLTITNSTITCNLSTATASFWSASAGSVAVNASGSTIVLAKAAPTFNRTFAGGGFVYGTLQYTVPSSPGAMIITGNNTFNTLSVSGGPRTLTLPANGTTTVTNWNVNGVRTTGYTYVSGASGADASYISTLDAPALDITGDIDLQIYAAPDNTTQAGGLFSKASASNVAYQLLQNGTVLELRLSTNGTTTVDLNSSAMGFVAGQAQWMRATWQQSTTTAIFYTGGTGSTPSWVVVSSGTINIPSISNQAVPLYLGNDLRNVHPFAGKIYKAQISNSISGSPVYSVDFTTTAQGTETIYTDSTSGATWTINGVMNGLIYINSSVGGSQATLTSAQAQYSNYVSIKDSKVDITPTWVAILPSNGATGANNTNWLFAISLTATMAAISTLVANAVVWAILPLTSLSNSTILTIIGLIIHNPNAQENTNVVFQGNKVGVPLQKKSASAVLQSNKVSVNL